MGFWGSWGFEERRVFERKVFGPPWKWRKRDLEDLRRRGDGIWVIDGVMMRRCEGKEMRSHAHIATLPLTVVCWFEEAMKNLG